MPSPEVLFGLPVISAEIGVSMPTLKSMIDSGQFPVVEIGGRYAIRRSMLDAWWESVEKEARLEALKRTQRLRKVGAGA